MSVSLVDLDAALEGSNSVTYSFSMGLEELRGSSPEKV